MKVSLVVLNAGKSAGQVIPIPQAQFRIGRDADCQLRPASAAISKQHCGFFIRDGKVILKDYDSTNGTFLNDQPVKGEVLAKHGDVIKAGPLQFRLNVEMPAVVPAKADPAKPTPLPPATKKSVAASNDDDAAALLLGLGIDDDTPGIKRDEIPEGSTVMDIVPVPSPAAPQPDKPKPPEKKGDSARDAARAILEKYSKRPRT